MSKFFIRRLGHRNPPTHLLPHSTGSQEEKVKSKKKKKSKMKMEWVTYRAPSLWPAKRKREETPGQRVTDQYRRLPVGGQLEARRSRWGSGGGGRLHPPLLMKTMSSMNLLWVVIQQPTSFPSTSSPSPPPHPPSIPPSCAGSSSAVSPEWLKWRNKGAGPAGGRDALHWVNELNQSLPPCDWRGGRDPSAACRDRVMCML